MFRCFTDMNPHSIAHFSNQTSNVCSWSDRATNLIAFTNKEAYFTHILKSIIYRIITLRQNYTYKYLGVFAPETMPIADPEWIPIRSCRRALGIWGILKTIDAHKRSKAIDAISETCLFPTKKEI